MKLHTSLTSPFARKVHILARLKGVDLVSAPANADGPRGYTGGLNPLGKIPMLVISGGTVLYDSPVICDYIDSLGNPLLPPSGPARWHELRLHALGDGLSDAVYNYRYETVRPDNLHWADIIARHETAIMAAINQLEETVETLGAPWTFGNISLICALDYTDFRAGHLAWRDSAPELAAWHKRFANEPIWQETFGYTA